MNILDYVIIAIYLSGVIIIGLRCKSKRRPHQITSLPDEKWGYPSLSAHIWRLLSEEAFSTVG